MLIRFQVSNHRSIREPVELSLVVIDKDRPQARPLPLVGVSLVPVAGVYGANASGKSNLLSGFAWLLEAVASSLQTWHHAIPVDQFALASDFVTAFEIELSISGVRYEYLLEVDVSHVLYEALFHYPESKRRRLFEREELSVKTQRGLRNLAGAKQLLTGQTLFLSAAHRAEVPAISAVVSELAHYQTWGPIPVRPWPLASGAEFAPGSRPGLRVLDLFEEPAPPDLAAKTQGFADPLAAVKRQALGLLRLADLGISDIAAYPQQVRTLEGDVASRGSVIRFGHSIGDTRRDFPLAEESKGTRAWLDLIGPILQALQTGSLLCVDELDASLHPKLCAEIVRLFESPQTNPRNAQLVFVAHDTSLLACLNRDEVWLCEKRPDGSTRLGALSDFAGERVRKSQNLQAGYLGGRFGALPQVNELEFLRSLGLVG